MTTQQHSAQPTPGTPLAVFVVVDDESAKHLPIAIHDLQHQRDITPQVVLLDRTHTGGIKADGAVVLRLGPEVSIGEAYRKGLCFTDAPIIAWHKLGVRNLPTRLRIQLDHLIVHPHIDLLTSNLVLTDAAGRIVALADPNKAGDAPTPLWQSGVMLRRHALASIGRSGDLPSELFLYMRQRRKGRVGHLPEPICVAPEQAFSALRRQSVVDAMSVREVQPPIAPPPLISVVIPVAGGMSSARRVLAALSKQDVGAQRFEVWLVDTGCRPLLDSTALGDDLPYTLHILHQESSSAAAVRNQAVRRSSGRIIVFLDEFSLPAPDVLRCHLQRQSQSGPARCVLGSTIARRQETRDSLSHLVQTTGLSTMHPEMEAGVSYKGQAFCSHNISVPRAALIRIGGFDESFCGAGAEDVELGLRLERALGITVAYDPSIRVYTTASVTIDQVVTRQRALGWCAQRMARKHQDPSILFQGRTPPPLDEFWRAVHQQMTDSVDEAAQLQVRITGLCHRERSQGGQLIYLDEIRPIVQRLCALEFGRGLLGSKAGLPLSDMIASV